MKKTYNMKLNKFFDKNMDCTVMELTVTKDMVDLLKPFTCPNEGMRGTDWCKQSLDENSNSSYSSDGEEVISYFQRYTIKTVLKSSVRWVTLLDLLFTKELMDGLTIKVPLNNIRAFTSVNESIESIKQLIKVAEEISHDREISITLNVKED